MIAEEYLREAGDLERRAKQLEINARALRGAARLAVEQKALGMRARATALRIAANPGSPASVAAAVVGVDPVSAAVIDPVGAGMRLLAFQAAARKLLDFAENAYWKHLPGCDAPMAANPQGKCDCGLDDLEAAMRGGA